MITRGDLDYINNQMDWTGLSTLNDVLKRALRDVRMGNGQAYSMRAKLLAYCQWNDYGGTYADDELTREGLNTHTYQDLHSFIRHWLEDPVPLKDNETIKKENAMKESYAKRLKAAVVEAIRSYLESEDEVDSMKIEEVAATAINDFHAYSTLRPEDVDMELLAKLARRRTDGNFGIPFDPDRIRFEQGEVLVPKWIAIKNAEVPLK